MNSFLKVMKALSDKNRVKIMKMLEIRVLCVCEIQEALGIAQSTASKHLKILEEAGLVNSFKEGLWVNYALKHGTENAYAASLLGNLRHWLSDDGEIKAMAARIPEIRREVLCGRALP